jgi:hypothetical protein
MVELVGQYVALVDDRCKSLINRRSTVSEATERNNEKKDDHWNG